MLTRFITFSSLLFLLLTISSGAAYAQDNPNQPPIDSDEANIQAITAFTISPNPAQAGSTITLNITFNVSALSTNRLCLYYPAALGQLTGFANQVTSGLQDVYTHAAAPGPGSFISGCSLISNAYTHRWDASNLSLLATAGDTLAITANLPSGVGGDFTFSFMQPVEGGNILNAFLTIVPVEPASVVHVDPANQCGGNTPCYTTLAAGVTYAEAGGVINLHGTLTGGAITDKNLTLQSATMATIGGTIEVTGDAEVTVRGLNLTHGSQAFTVANGATLTAYANNITALNTPVAGTGNFAHNWWGSYLIQPGGVTGDSSSGDWSKRLGAVVDSYGLGTLGQARVTLLDGTIDYNAVIVSHGREEFRAPFGQATSNDGNTQCSDYYDIFVVGSPSGQRLVSIPIDSRSACTPIYDAKALFMFDIGVKPDGRGWETCTTHGTAYSSPSCWYSLPDATQTANEQGRRLRVTLPVESLQYTPFVSANENLLDPTAILLHNLRVSSQQNGIGVTLIIVLTILMMVFVVTRRRLSH